MDRAEELIRRECDVWDELQAVPSYCERFVEQETDEVMAVICIQSLDELVHTDLHPFCDDPSCGCHDDVELMMEHLEHPFDEGLITRHEYYRIKEGKQL